PIVTVRYLPTVPLTLARPLGNKEEFELSRKRDVSQALAANTITRASTWCSLPSVLSMYVMPLARPLRSSVTSRAMACVTRFSFPVLSAGAISTFVEEKFEFVRQPRLHCPQ